MLCVVWAFLAGVSSAGLGSPAWLCLRVGASAGMAGTVGVSLHVVCRPLSGSAAGESRQQCASRLQASACVLFATVCGPEQVKHGATAFSSLPGDLQRGLKKQGCREGAVD